MYDLRINRWYGRGGGHMKQLIYATYLAEKTKSTLTYPIHGWVKNKKLIFGDDSSGRPVICKSFFYGKDLMGHIPGQFNMFRLGRKHINPILEYEVPELPDDNLVIHLRSGDIFWKSPHKLYVQPPLNFYRKIIKEGGYKKIIIVTDKSKNNPCIAPLMKLYNAKMVSGETIDDFSTLIGATNLVVSKSNFPIAASWLSVKLKNVYSHVITGTSPISKDMVKQVAGLGITMKQYSISGYIPHKGWAASPKQLSMMLKHPINNIKLV